MEDLYHTGYKDTAIIYYKKENVVIAQSHYRLYYLRSKSENHGDGSFEHFKTSAHWQVKQAS